MSKPIRHALERALALILALLLPATGGADAVVGRGTPTRPRAPSPACGCSSSALPYPPWPNSSRRG